MTAKDTLTVRQINRATLARQMLLARAKTSALRAIERLVALQAQVARPPFVGLWTRIEGFRREELAELYEQRKVVRATSLRGTIHLMTAKDFADLRPAIQPALTRIMKGLLVKQREAIDVDRIVSKARHYFDEEPRTFDELRKHFAEIMPKLDPRAAAHVVRTQLPLVQVPTDAPWSFTGVADFATAETWLDREIPRAEAPARALVLRYLAAFGPASVADAQTWSSLDKLAPVFEELRPELRVFRDERGKELFDLPRAPRPREDEEAPVRFLAEFDNILLSHAERSRVLPVEHRPFLKSPNGLVPGTVLVDGFVAGAWSMKRTRSRGKEIATLVVEPFEPLTKAALRAIETEGEALARFLESPDPLRSAKRAGRRVENRSVRGRASDAAVDAFDVQITKPKQL